MMCSDDASRQVESHSGKQVVEMPSATWRLDDWYIVGVYTQMKYASTYPVGIYA